MESTDAHPHSNPSPFHPHDPLDARAAARPGGPLADRRVSPGAAGPGDFLGPVYLSLSSGWEGGPR